jgi:hypothetical protein
MPVRMLGASSSQRSVESPPSPRAIGRPSVNDYEGWYYLLQAREELDRDVYNALRLPFGLRTRQRLIAIAIHPVLATHVSQLPPCWGTLYALTELEDDVLRAALVDGRINPRLQRNEIRTKVLLLPPKEKGAARPELEHASDLTPPQLQAQIERLGWSRFRQEVLPRDWISSLTNTALSLATPEKLIETLERRLPPANKTARKRLQALKAAVTQPPTIAGTCEAVLH